MFDSVKDVLTKDIKDFSFEKNDSVEPNAALSIPAYDCSLIDFLKEESEKVKYLYDEVMQFALNTEYEKAAGRLDEFNVVVRQLYQKSDHELYAYLKRYIHQQFPKREKAFSELSLEMKNISIDIFFTTIQSTNLPLNERNYGDFIREFRHVGELLKERFKREEEVLFPLYESTNEAISIS